MKKTGSSPTPTRYNIDGASFGRPRPKGPHSQRFEFPIEDSAIADCDHPLELGFTPLKLCRGRGCRAGK